MTSKKDYMNMAAFALMAASGYGDCIPPDSAPKELDKSQQKKCKSCANFVKQCYKGGCPWHSVVDPWQAACKEHYKKKKKKR